MKRNTTGYSLVGVNLSSYSVIAYYLRALERGGGTHAKAIPK